MKGLSEITKKLGWEWDRDYNHHHYTKKTSLNEEYIITIDVEEDDKTEEQMVIECCDKFNIEEFIEDYKNTYFFRNDKEKLFKHANEVKQMLDELKEMLLKYMEE